MKGRSSHVVLIAEHNKLLRFLTADIMKDAGFVALHASDADEAITILESRSDIALMLTSVKMPGRTDGVGLVARGHTARRAHAEQSSNLNNASCRCRKCNATFVAAEP